MTQTINPTERRREATHEYLIQRIRGNTHPAVRLTINPRVAGIATDEMTTLLDDANRIFLHSLFGTKWKQIASPLTVLCPESESRRTKGNQPNLLHYHGCVWTSNSQVEFRYRAGEFSSILQKLLYQRFKPQSVPTVMVQDFDPLRSWATYCTKNYGRDFDDRDTYVFGHIRTGRRGYSVRSL